MKRWRLAYREDTLENIKELALDVISTIMEEWDGRDPAMKVCAVEGVLALVAAVEESIANEGIREAENDSNP